MEPRGRDANLRDRSQHRDDLLSLLGRHASDGNARVPEVLEARDRRRVATRTPPLCDPDGLEGATPLSMPVEKLSREVDREIATSRPLWLHAVAIQTSVEVESQDDVVERDAGVKAAVLVEVDHVIDGIRRHILADIREGAAVPHRV